MSDDPPPSALSNDGRVHRFADVSDGRRFNFRANLTQRPRETGVEEQAKQHERAAIEGARPPLRPVAERKPHERQQRREQQHGAPRGPDAENRTHRGAGVLSKMSRRIFAAEKPSISARAVGTMRWLSAATRERFHVVGDHEIAPFEHGARAGGRGQHARRARRSAHFETGVAARGPHQIDHVAD